ncbi:lytic murein transglycosylase B [Paraglaciecola sp. L3A3]|uniref:lytic murein transglycosylase B n=1 Tax=Paraglaciecola sp. L3A3 TaxID=2686358 RepID=UPI0018EF1789|nr:lytic murein transglycosylase B [Paraglaciecola sp. L3A3]
MKFLSLFSVMFLSLSFSLSATTNSPAELQKQFIETMVGKHKFSREFVETTLAKSNKNSKVLESIAKPWEAKPWHQYYPIFLTEKRLTKGLEFWQQHKESLAKAEKEMGVPPQIILAIIGVETFYGSYTGNYSVLDALTTLGFYYPPRAKFFSSELEQLFLLAQEENFDISQLKGSYAGAMGWGQFISSSYRHYAVDFDGDGVRDLLNNPVDAIGSVANYFKQHGWKAGQDIAYKAEVKGNHYKDYVRKSLKYRDNWAQLKAAGVRVAGQKISDDTRVKLLEFEQKNSKEYWLGLRNFYVITRYNHSPLYAMAVFQFSEQLKQAMDKTNN